MYPEFTQFKNWLRCQYPSSSASVHYTNDLALFFSFIKKSTSTITAQDVDRYISHSRQQKHRPSTINRRLSALRTFYYFLAMTCAKLPACPVLLWHRLRKSYHLPSDVNDPDINSYLRKSNVCAIKRCCSHLLVATDKQIPYHPGTRS
jgi:site-specific recombinase XerD